MCHGCYAPRRVVSFCFSGRRIPRSCRRPHRQKGQSMRTLPRPLLALSAVLLAAGGYVAVTQGTSLAATTASVWLTTADKANLLKQQASVAFGTGGSGST